MISPFQAGSERRVKRTARRPARRLPRLRLKRSLGATIFDWDDAKSARCLLERGFGFDHAARIFAGPVLERIDRRKEYGELRIQAIGKIDGCLYFVCFTDRVVDGESVRWIISARRAHEKELRQWLGNRWTT